MKTKERVKFIKQTEEQFDVASWKVKGVYFWHLIRNRFIVDKRKKTNKNELKFWIKLIWGTFINSFILIKKSFNYKEKNLFISGGDVFERIEDGYKHKFFQSLWEENLATPIYLEYRKGKIKGSVNSIEFLTPTLIFTKIIGFFIRVDLEKLRDYNRFIKYARQKLTSEYNHIISKDFVSREIKIVKASEIYWKFLLKKLSVKKVYIVAYYNGHFYGLIKACRELGIDTIEIQHGVQGAYHLAYGSFYNIPQQGYDTLPKIYWCWNEIYFNSINEWASKTSFHKAYNKGHTWINYLRKNKILTEGHNKDIILFTSQPYKLEIAFSQFVLEVLTKIQDLGIVYLRLHPSQLSYKEKIREYLKSNNIYEYVNMDVASTENLAKILNRTKLHITLDSSVIIEADMFDVDSVLLSEKSEHLYEPYIESGRAVVVKNILEFSKIVKKKLAVNA